MSTPTVDIVMASYNGARYIGEQLDSILAQTFQDFRLLVRDDGSTDHTLSILQSYASKYPDKVILVPSYSRLGIRGNFSELLCHAKAPYTMLADQDDVWNRDKIALTLNKMHQSEGIYSRESPILVHTDLEVVNEKLEWIDSSFWHYVHLHPQRPQTLNRVLTQNVVTGCTVMINRPLLKFALPIPADCVMHDWWLALVAAALGHIVALPTATMLYRQHEQNTLGAKKFWSMATVWKSLNKDPMLDRRKIRQAEDLLHRYTHLLTKNELETLSAFIACGSVTYFRRGLLIARYKLFKNGLLRNLAHVLLR